MAVRSALKKIVLSAYDWAKTAVAARLAGRCKLESRAYASSRNIFEATVRKYVAKGKLA